MIKTGMLLRVALFVMLVVPVADGGLRERAFVSHAFGNVVRQDDPRGWRFVTLPAPDFARPPARVANSPTSAGRLVLVSSKPNNITDDDKWFAKNNLTLPLYSTTDAPDKPEWPQTAPLPSNIPTTSNDNLLVRAIRQPRVTLLVYGRNYGEGRYLVALDSASGEFRYGYDFVNYAHAPGGVASQRDYVYQNINWAVQEGDTLYVSHSHPTYARSSKGQNAYITAIDTRANRVLWRSQPLVSNASNFEIIDDAIVAGYGFTNEPDFLYVLDKKTGAVAHRLPVKSGATYIINKAGRIYVRTYNLDLVLRLERGKTPVKAAR